MRYLKLDLISLYGPEFYCAVSSIGVYGVDAIEQMLGDLIMVSDKSSAKVIKFKYFFGHLLLDLNRVVKMD